MIVYRCEKNLLDDIVCIGLNEMRNELFFYFFIGLFLPREGYAATISAVSDTAAVTGNFIYNGLVVGMNTKVQEYIRQSNGEGLPNGVTWTAKLACGDLTVSGSSGFPAKCTAGIMTPLSINATIINTLPIGFSVQIGIFFNDSSATAVWSTYFLPAASVCTATIPDIIEVGSIGSSGNEGYLNDSVNINGGRIFLKPSRWTFVDNKHFLFLSGPSVQGVSVEFPGRAWAINGWEIPSSATSLGGYWWVRSSTAPGQYSGVLSAILTCN